MKLQRNELINYEKEWINNHPTLNDNPTEYISFLDGLNEIIMNHDYDLDERFVTYGRRDFLRQEFSNYLNDKSYAGRGKYNDAFADLSDYYSGETWINIGSVPSNLNFHEIEDADYEYRKEGIICKQEIEIIKEMMQEFKNNLNGLSNYNNNIKLKNTNLDEKMIVDTLIKKMEELPINSETTILNLLSTKAKLYNDSQLNSIAANFFEKYKKNIEFSTNSNEKIGLIYNLPFKKKQ